MKVIYWHPHYINSRGKSGRLTVAYVINSDALCFAVSYCSPKDQFSRKTGAARALERLTFEPTVVSPLRKDLHRIDIEDFIKTYIEIIGTPGMPQTDIMIQTARKQTYIPTLALRELIHNIGGTQ